MQLAIFDLDGTLTRTTHIDAVCFLRACAEEFGVHSVDTNWTAYTHSTDSGISLEILQAHLQRVPSADEVARLQRRFVALLARAFLETPESCTEIAGARAALQGLRKHPDWSVAIATGSWRTSAVLKMDTAGIDRAGLPAAFADDSMAREDIIRTALARAQAQHAQPHFSRVVYLGDAVWDVRAAIELQLPFIGVGSGGREAALRAAGARVVLADFGDPEGLLRALADAAVPARNA